MGRFADYKGVSLVREWAKLQKAIEENNRRLEAYREEIAQLQEEQEQDFTTERAEALVVKEMAVKDLAADTRKKQIALEDMTGEYSLHRQRWAIDEDQEGIELKHEDLDKEREACRKALENYKKANDKYKASVKKLFDEYQEDIRAAGGVYMNVRGGVNDYHDVFPTSTRELFAEEV